MKKNEAGKKKCEWVMPGVRQQNIDTEDRGYAWVLIFFVVNNLYISYYWYWFHSINLGVNAPVIEHFVFTLFSIWCRRIKSWKAKAPFSKIPLRKAKFWPRVKYSSSRVILLSSHATHVFWLMISYLVLIKWNNVCQGRGEGSGGNKGWR